MFKFLSSLFEGDPQSASQNQGRASTDQVDMADAFIYSLEIEEDDLHPDLTP